MDFQIVCDLARVTARRAFLRVSFAAPEQQRSSGKNQKKPDEPEFIGIKGQCLPNNATFKKAL
jgi:hypothetical protein